MRCIESLTSIDSGNVTLVTRQLTVENGKFKLRNGMANSIIEPKSFDFAVRIVKLYNYLNEHKKEYTLSKQLLRSDTSIGANISEAQQA